MWRLNAEPRRIFPVPLFLNRLAAPLCVLSYIFFAMFLL
jgi:hypothetical protein